MCNIVIQTYIYKHSISYIVRNKLTEGTRKMSYIVRYAGWIVYEGNDADKAFEEYRACGPYGTIHEVDE